MAADFKSHVLRREEKGFVGVPFKRWLLAGVAGGMVFAFSSLLLGTMSIPPAVAVTLLLLVLTGERDGLARWQSLLLRLRGQLILRAAAQPESRIAQLAAYLELPVAQVVRLDGDQLFAPPEVAALSDYADWVTVLHPAQAEYSGCHGAGFAQDLRPQYRHRQGRVHHSGL